jgi:hypothetical protein
MILLAIVVGTWQTITRAAKTDGMPANSKQAHSKPMVSKILTDSPLPILAVTVATD